MLEGETLTFNQFLEGVVSYELFWLQETVGFDAREIVQVFPDVVFFSFTQIDSFVGSHEEQVVEVTGSDGRFLFLHGSLFYGVVCQSKAVLAEGTAGAIGALWNTLECSELHESLVVPSGVVPVEQLIGHLRE